MRTISTSPSAHFLAAGFVLFVLTRWIEPAADDGERYNIVVTADEIAELRTGHLARHGQAPSAAETTALIEAAVIEELLYREAIARGLDAADAVVERRLVQDMRFLSAPAGTDDTLLLRQAHALGLRDGDPVIRRRLIQRMRTMLSQEHDSEGLKVDDLRSYFEKHRDQFRQPPRHRLSQIFFAGEDEQQRAAAMLAALEASGAGAEAALGRGDPFIAGNDVPPQSERSLAKTFGPQFARRLPSVPIGVWSGPITSSFGVHLIWIHHRESEQPLVFDDVRDAVRERLEAERAEEVLRRRIKMLRAGYNVEVAGQIAGDASGPHRD
jgi:hypothetical protein